MNYSRIYDQLITKFRNASVDGYTESHHIVPRCLGGGNEPENLVDLPARYHFVAHLLLAKIYGGKLTYAAWRMLTTKNYTSRDYAWLQKQHSEEVSQRMRGNKFGMKLKGRKRPDISQRLVGNKINVGRKHTAETRAKVAAASKRRGTTSAMAKKSWETRRKNGTDKMTPERIAQLKASRGDMTGSKNPMYGRKHSPETKAKMAAKSSARQRGEGNTWFGKTHSLETKAKIGIKSAERMKGNQNTKGMRFKTVDGKRIRIQ